MNRFCRLGKTEQHINAESIVSEIKKLTKDSGMFDYEEEIVPNQYPNHLLNLLSIHLQNRWADQNPNPSPHPVNKLIKNILKYEKNIIL